MRSKFRNARLAGLISLAGTLAGCATDNVARLSDAVDLGRGEKGELCRAERLWGDTTASGDFDRAYNLRCRGWTDTQLAGRLYALDNKPGAMDILDKSRATRMLCGDPVAVQIAGIGPAQARRCIEREAGFPSLSVVLVRGKKVYAADGLERFSANLDAGLQLLVGRSGGAGSNSVPKGRIDVGAAKAPSAAIEASNFVDENALNGRRGEVIDYSVRGENIEAREIVTRYSARLPASATATDRVGFLLESALSESNLGYPDVAASYLERAEAILSSGNALTGPTGDFLRAKLRVYRAMDALNRRDFKAAISAAADGADAAAQLTGIVTAQIAADSQANPLGDRAVLRELNSRGADARLRSATLRPDILRAQALYIRGAALRSSGDITGALAALDGANASLNNVEREGVDTSSLQWIRSQIAVERARIAVVQKRFDAARGYFAESVERLEKTSTYAGSPLLAQRKLAYAAFLVEHGDRAGASKQYADAMSVMRLGGPSAASSGAGLEGYFALLQEDAAGKDPAAAAAARAQFFIASQLVNPPEVAAQIAQIQKIFESGSSEAAVRAKTLQDLDREGRGLATQIAGLPTDDVKDHAKLQALLDVNAARSLQVRRELAGDQQYLQASDSAVTLAELQATLRPGEAYVKLLTLPRISYSVVVTHDDAMIFPAGLSTAKLTALVVSIRSSIDGNIARDGRVVPLVFDVNEAFELYNALLKPAAALLAKTQVLISEPTGAMTQLPFGILVADQASVDWFAENVKKNSRDYTKVGFLAGRYDLDTTVSPRAFLVARTQPASRAKFPYIGFGFHAQPSAVALEMLPNRGALAGRCTARADALRAGFGSLKSIGAKELATASELAGAGSVLVEGADFTDTALDARKDYRQFAVVHFATHGLKQGELDCDSPPALITSIGDDPQSDGLLSFEEIANLQFDANLVVLSACNTAAETRASRASGTTGFRAGRAGQGATLNGLVRAFLVAGSRTVVTTHWAIPDGFKTRDGRQVAASTQLIETFFKTGITQSIASSMRAAQAGMIGSVDTSHPYYWGAFAIVGDGEKLMFARAS
jgi:CHAT domain-containing protein